MSVVVSKSGLRESGSGGRGSLLGECTYRSMSDPSIECVPRTPFPIPQDPTGVPVWTSVFRGITGRVVGLVGSRDPGRDYDAVRVMKEHSMQCEEVFTR